MGLGVLRKARTFKRKKRKREKDESLPQQQLALISALQEGYSFFSSRCMMNMDGIGNPRGKGAQAGS